MSALSALSSTMLRTWTVFVLGFLALSFVNVGRSRKFKSEDMAVLFATFVQVFFVAYVIHWVWHRYDLSFDAVIKYFACGFVLCSATALAVEMAKMGVFRAVVAGVVNVRRGELGARCRIRRRRRWSLLRLGRRKT